MNRKLCTSSIAAFASVLFGVVVWTSYMPLTAGKRAVSAKASAYEARGARPVFPARLLPSALSSTSLASQMRLLKSYGKLPLSFEPNRGQAESRVKFLSRRNSYTLFLTSTEAVLGFSKARASAASEHGAIRTRLPASLTGPHRAARELSSSSTPHGRDGTTRAGAQSSLRMRLVGANPAPRLIALDELPGKSNYFIGRDPAKWRTNVPNYAKVKYQNVYPGVDLVYYGNEGRLEFDFVVARGADPKAIKLDISGAKGERIDSLGDLVLDMGDGEIRFHKPVVYQALAALWEHQAGQNFVDGRFVLLGNSQAGFEIGAYDRTKPLVIDPVLSYSTYLGGTGDDLGGPNGMQTIAVDGEGNAYIGGVTDSVDFPVTAEAFQTKFTAGGNGSQCTIAGDAFLTKVNARGDAVVYSTYLGGSSDDCGEGIAVDAAGNAYIAGETLSTDFPITAGAFQPVCKSCSNGKADTFAAKLSLDGSVLVYSTYLGGSDWDGVPMIALDSAGNVYIQGSTFSTDFPVTKGAFQTTCHACTNGALNTYVTKLNPDGTALVYSTYLGGSTQEICGAQIAVDAEGSVYVDGIAFSTDFPTTPGAFRTKLSGICGTPPNTSACPDGFVTKLNPAGTQLAYSTFLGGSGYDFVNGIAVDGEGNAYVTGGTSSSDFPTTPGAFQTSYAGGACSSEPGGLCLDAFVTKINPSGTALVYSTYIGGSGDESGAGTAVDSDGNAYVGGNTTSTDFPMLNAFQPANAGGQDIFVTELNAAGDALVYSTYLGGSNNETTGGIALDDDRNVYVEGFTTSSDFLAVNPVQPQFGGGTYDALLAKISPVDAPGLGLSRLSVNFGAQPGGAASPPQTVTVHSVGSQPLVIRKIRVEPKDEFAQTNTCTHALPPGGTCTISITLTAKDKGEGEKKAQGESEGVLVVVANSEPASRRVRLTVMDHAGSASAQNANPRNTNTSVSALNRRMAILRKKAAH